MSKLFFQENMTNSADQLTSTDAGGNGNSNANETPQSLQVNRECPVYHEKKSRHSIPIYRERFRAPCRYPIYRYEKNISRIDGNRSNIYNHNHNQYENQYKRMGSNEHDAEDFGTAFGAAWKRFRGH